MPEKRVVLTYRSNLLPGSETFVEAQTEALRAFRGVYVGLRDVPGIVLEKHRRVLLAGSGVLGRLARGRILLSNIPRRQVRCIKRFSPVLVHAHFGVDGLVAAKIAHQLRLPFVVTFHGYDATLSDAALLRGGLEQRLYVKHRLKLGNAQRLLCVSEFIRRRVVARGLPYENTIVHYVGVDTTKYRAQTSIERKPVVLFVGRLVHNKGCIHLINAMDSVQSRFPYAELVIIGDGPLRSTLEQRAKGNPQVRFLGAQSPDVVRTWMNVAKVFCVPSVTAPDGSSEGFGIVFIEAQSMRLPVVSFATGGIPEAVRHGETGLLSDEGDEKALAENIQALLSNESMWHTFSNSGRSRVERFFELRRQTEILEKIYESVVDAKPICDPVALV